MLSSSGIASSKDDQNYDLLTNIVTNLSIVCVLTLFSYKAYMLLKPAF